MELYGYEFIRESDLAHHGIKGQKWGVRRFQNEDGTWTAAGKERYGDGTESTRSSRGSAPGFSGASRKSSTSVKQNDPERQKRVETMKKVAKIGAAVAGTALVAYGGYKLNKVLNDKVNQNYIQKGIRAASKSDSWMKAAQENTRVRLHYQDLASSKSLPSNMRQYYKDLAEVARSGEGNAHKMGQQAAREASAAIDRVRRYNAGENYSLREKADVVRRAVNKRRGYHYYS